MAVLYLIFNEGYSATEGEALIRHELCGEAIRLGKLLVSLVPDESRELYLGVTEDGAMTLLQGGCTELSAVAALREFASW